MKKLATLKTVIWNTISLWDGHKEKPKGVVIMVVSEGSYGEEVRHHYRRVKYQDNDDVFKHHVENAKHDLQQKMDELNAKIQAENDRETRNKQEADRLCDLVRSIE